MVSSWWRVVMLAVAVCARACPVAPTTSATTGTIQGVVTEESAEGAPLAFVTVDATTPAMTGSVAELTDEGGAYTLSNLAPGEYVVTFYYGDVVAKREHVLVSAGKASIVRQSLDLRASTAEIIVIGHQ